STSIYRGARCPYWLCVHPQRQPASKTAPGASLSSGRDPISEKRTRPCGSSARRHFGREVKVQFFEVNDREFTHFENISDALRRLEKGTYGRCMFCGHRIQADVLAKTPWVTECRGCGDQKSHP